MTRLNCSTSNSRSRSCTSARFLTTPPQLNLRFLSLLSSGVKSCPKKTEYRCGVDVPWSITFRVTDKSQKPEVEYARNKLVKLLTRAARSWLASKVHGVLMAATAMPPRLRARGKSWWKKTEMVEKKKKKLQFQYDLTLTVTGRPVLKERGVNSLQISEIVEQLARHRIAAKQVLDDDGRTDGRGYFYRRLRLGMEMQGGKR